MMGDFLRDLRGAVRVLLASPVVSLFAVVSLGLGIGANAAVFSILDGLLLRALPVREPSRLVLLSRGPNTTFTYPIWAEIRRRPEQFRDFAAWGTATFDLARTGRTEMVEGLWVSGRFFEVLGVPAVAGRILRDSDDRRGGGADGPVAVISYPFWQRRFGGAADVIGRTLTLNRADVPFRIVGVAAAGFFGPTVGRSFDVAIPLGTEPLFRPRESALDHRSNWWLRVVARLERAQTAASLTAALRGVQPQIREATLPTLWPKWELPNYLREPLSLEPAATGVSPLRTRYERPLVVLMIIAAMVLLVACANVANLQLARGTARRHELAVRRALGATRWRLARQCLVESVLLSAAGTALGLVVARWGSRFLVGQLSTPVSAAFLDLPLDWRLLGFSAGVGAASAILFGTIPALGAARTGANETLREGRGTLAPGRHLAGNTLVVAQVGLSLALVAAAGLFGRSFTELSSLDPGFDTDRILAVRVSARPGDVAPEAAPALFDRVREAAASVPGAERVSLSTVVPVTESNTMYRMEVLDASAPPRPGSVHANFVGPGWFGTLGVPLRAGRDFSPRDGAAAPLVVIVNEALAKRFFGGHSPLGRRIRISVAAANAATEVVGVVADSVYQNLRAAPPPTMYFPVDQYARQSHHPRSPAISVLVRSGRGSPLALAPAVISAVAGVDPTLAVSIRTLREQVDGALAQERLVAGLSLFFGSIALLLAGVGVYGVTAYAVGRRRAEIGVRMALGAAPASVLRLVLSRVAALAALGVAAGGAASFWAARFIGTLLYGVEPRDRATFGAAAAVLLVTALLAGAAPAWSAARTEPTRSLRSP